MNPTWHPTWQFEMGRKAGLRDEAPHGNPFPAGNLQHDQWRAGWQQGQIERRAA